MTKPEVQGISSRHSPGSPRRFGSGDRLLLADGLIELRVEAVSGAGYRDRCRRGRHTWGAQRYQRARRCTARVCDHREGRRGPQVRSIRGHRHGGDQLRAERCGFFGRRGSCSWIRARADVPLVAKLERPQALDNLDEILTLCQAVMIARRRSRARDATGTRAARSKGNHPSCATARNPRDSRNPGARIHDARAETDARRGQ